MMKVIVFWGEDQGHTFLGELNTQVKDGRLIISSRDGSIHSEFAVGNWTRFIKAQLSEDELAQLKKAAEKEVAVE